MLVIGVGLKGVIHVTGSATFDADEAILALMARHILQGEWPLFFYGQGYMGALDAYLTVPYFLLFGQTVLALRLLQMTLYAGVLVTTYVLAYRVTGSRFGATAAGLLCAIPPVLLGVYTTVTLGNYGEVLLLNNLIWLIGWDIFSGRNDRWQNWFLIGLLGGLGWWGMALVIVALAPLMLQGLWRFRKKMPWKKLSVLIAGFLIGALPWIIGIVTNAQGVIGDLFGERYGAVEASIDSTSTILDRLLSLTVFNLPALFGLRQPWSAEFIALPLGVITTAIYIMALWRGVGRKKGQTYRQIALVSLISAWGVLLVAFLLTPFGVDLTGRYLLPLYPPLAIIVADWLVTLHREQEQARTWIPAGILILVLGYNLYGNVQVLLHNPPGYTTQFDLISHIPHDHDEELVAFLAEIDVERGYSNYWITFRFAFLTGEQVLFSPRLPYKSDMSFTYLDDRYPAYSEAVYAADRVVYVTSNHPKLDAEIEKRFRTLNISYLIENIGPYTVFYDLPGNIEPETLGAFGAVSGPLLQE